MEKELDIYLWNNPEIKVPPVNKFKMYEKVIDVEKLRDFFTRCPNIMTNQPELRIETEYLSRIVYRMSRKFRNDIGFRYTKKILVALKKYLNTTISTDIMEFLNCVPLRYYAEGTYLPTKQMLQYVLVRLQTLMKFMTRILICCENATRFYKDRISRGQSWNVSLLALANHSKIWFLCKTLCMETACLYSNLLPNINKFQLNGPEWLHAEYEFPTNLKEWLGYDLENNVPDHIIIPSSNDIKIVDITEDDDVEFCCEYNLDCEIINTPRVNTSNKEQINSDDVISKKRRKLETIDIGETVTRTSSIQNLSIITKTENDVSTVSDKNQSTKNPILKKKSKLPAQFFVDNINKDKLFKNQTNSIININNIKSSKDLILCLKQEEEYRKLDLQKAFTKNLGLMQWHAFKNKMQVYIKKLSTKNKSVESKKAKLLIEKIKKEWREIDN